MKKYWLLAGILSLILVSPSFAEDAIEADNEQNLQKLPQIQKEYPEQISSKGNFYGKTKEGNSISGTKNVFGVQKDYPKAIISEQYTKVPLQKRNCISLPRFDNRLSHRPPQNIYNRFQNSPFMSRPQSMFDSRYSHRPNPGLGNPQDLSRNGYFHYCNNYHNINRAHSVHGSRYYTTIKPHSIITFK